MKLPDRRLPVYAGIVLFGILFLLPFLGSVNLFDWDEINFAESAREMIETGNYLTVQIDFMPFWEKPPLFFWLQVVSMKLFGVNEFAARFPNFICGIVSLLMLYHIGRQVYGHRFGLLWLLTYGTSILPFFYFRSGIIDPWFNLFIFMGITCFIFYLDPERKRNRVRNVALSALFLGLAVLTKGPVAILIFVICFLVYLIVRRFRLDTSFRDVFLFILVLTVTGGTWFLLQVMFGNSHILRDFIAYQIRLFSTGDAGHSGFFGYHLVVVFLGVFPASVIALKSFTKKSEPTELCRLFKQWMFIMFWVVIILFSIVQTKILHYSSLTYFPLTFLAAWVWEKWLDRKIEISAWQVVIFLLIALFYAAVAVILPLAASRPEWLLSRNFGFLDEFTRGALEADVHWSGWEWIIGALFLLGVAFSAVQILRRNPSGLVALHLVTLFFVTLSIYTFTERIEGYTQRAAIKFYESLEGSDVYVNTLGFKSYAHLFYFDKQPPEKERRDNVDWILNHTPDKDAYFVMKVDKAERYLQQYPELEFIREVNGYVFAVKKSGTID